LAETIITAQDYAVDSDVVLESAVREVKSVPRDTVNVVGDAVKYVSDETVTAAKGVAAVFKSNPVEKAEKAGMLEVASAWDSSNDIIFRSYKVTAAVGKELAAGAETAPGTTVDVSGFFNGIEFPKGTSAYFRPEFNRLLVRQTLANTLAIEDRLAEQHSAVRKLMGKQVEIETKFVEVNQSTLNELGFKWNMASSKTLGDVSIAGQDIFSDGLRTTAGAIGSSVASGLLEVKSAGDWNLTINALEQSDNADVLSAPRIVTRDGSKASILVGEERTVSKEFDVKNSESSLFIQHDLDSMLVGVQLDVTPKIRSDKLIDLDLKPKIIDLIGYDTYNPVPNAKLKNNTTAAASLTPLISGILTPNDIDASLQAQIPYYRLREISSQVTVADGSTVGMGGLIYDKLETYKDKVPLLGSIPLVGRLFRSEGEKSVKRNLMIFVTATQVDVNGRRAADLALNK
jgi:general secretion pathway protein D